MAGGLVKHRALQRKSSHRRALLRNLVESLIEHESISTTWPKAKEAQKLAEKMITHGKKATEASRRQTLKFFFVRGELHDIFDFPLTNVIETTADVGEAVWPTSRTIHGQTGWIYARTADRAYQRRSSTLGDPRACGWTKGHAICVDR
jgi:ribosomal protein L17